MSLIAAVFFEDGSAGMWGDSIVTRSFPPSPHFGVTSQGEAVQYRSDLNEDYVETACKVGLFGQNTICGLTTSNLQFAFTVLDLEIFENVVDDSLGSGDLVM